MKKILVVEDQLMFLNMVCFKLEKAGFTPVVARNGEEAIKKFESVNPLLVITDLNMPKKDGFEFIKYMRDIKGSHTPVLVLSMEDEDESKGKVIKLGANDFLSKPFNPNELMDRVNRLIAPSSNLLPI